MTYYVYMLRCADHSLYTGLTNNVLRRMKEHFEGSPKAAKYTLNHHPVKLEALWKCETRKQAAKLEYHIKQLSKTKKEQLIDDNEMFHQILDKLKVEDYQRTSIDET